MTEKKPNRLINEKSPYLLQHAYNPVDWYPWGEEAFEKARALDKPIFLSIGYATCHWCHVMAEECFDDEEVAILMNEAFIAIKVDREELPEIDALYMEFAQTMILGSAGWPLHVILTPDLKPFFAATYMPKHAERGMNGVVEVIEYIDGLWKSEEKERLIAQSEQICAILSEHVHTKGIELPSVFLIEQAADILFKIADPVFGGIKGAPKFPLGYQANFLLSYFVRSFDNRALFLVEKTLEMMHRGGIYDHLAGGFCRYSVDYEWHIPHFEKMLYDNALLVSSYLALWKITKDVSYSQVIHEVLLYCIDTFRSDRGGFYSAEDADVDGVEGLFYTWTRKEILDILGAEDGDLFCYYYGILDFGEVEGRSVLWEQFTVDEFCFSHMLHPTQFAKQLQIHRAVLNKERNKRKRPFCDKKIITSYNGLILYAFSEAFRAFPEDAKQYLGFAEKIARFIQNNLYKDGILFRRWIDQEVRFHGVLDDYAFLIHGLIALFEAGAGTEWLSWAISLTDTLQEKFKAVNGAFYQTDGSDKRLLIRKIQFSDGAEPSGNSMHAENLVKLWQITGNSSFLTQAEDIFKAAKKFIDVYPLGYCYLLLGLLRYFDHNKATVVIALNDSRDFEQEIRIALSQCILQNHVIIWKHPDDELLLDLCENVEELVPQNDCTSLYICHDGRCERPITDKESMLQVLRSL